MTDFRHDLTQSVGETLVSRKYRLKSASLEEKRII